MRTFIFPQTKNRPLIMFGAGFLVRVFTRLGGDLLFHDLSHSTIGATSFHGRVRYGNVCLSSCNNHQAVQIPLWGFGLLMTGNFVCHSSRGVRKERELNAYLALWDVLRGPLSSKGRRTSL